MLWQIDIRLADNVYLKVADEAQKAGDSQAADMIAWADWIIPQDPKAPKPSGAMPGTAPDGLNMDFCRMANKEIQAMRERVLGGKRCYSKHHHSIQLYGMD